jgi:hypothetical protein
MGGIAELSSEFRGTVTVENPAEAGRVLHPLEPVFTGAVSWAKLRLASLARIV